MEKRLTREQIERVKELALQGLSWGMSGQTQEWIDGQRALIDLAGNALSLADRQHEDAYEELKRDRDICDEQLTRLARILDPASTMGYQWAGPGNIFERAEQLQQTLSKHEERVAWLEQGQQFRREHSALCPMEHDADNCCCGLEQWRQQEPQAGPLREPKESHE